MNLPILKANALLFVAALVWGTTFVAQRVGMDHMGPFLFSGIRFALGAIILAPLALRAHNCSAPSSLSTSIKWLPLWGSALAGVLMCAGINLQQVGLVYTTAGKAAFITGLYVIIVPVLGLLFRQRPGLGLWVGAPLGVVGLFLLSVDEAFALGTGDGWVLACAFVWAFHMLLLGWLSPQLNSFVLAFGQSAVCAVLSLLVALFFEEISFSRLYSGVLPLLYGGIMSVGVGFTLQIIAQKDSPPAHAAIILQLEAVVGAASGWIMLGETMEGRQMSGALLMLAGMLVAQLWVPAKRA